MEKFQEWDGNLEKLLEKYEYQPQLTNRLDAFKDRHFDQALINEIVLWKVNRYAQLSENTLAEINQLKDLAPGEYKRGKAALKQLLRERGVDLPMASTILRFRNPRVFQIIDRHAYRAVYGNKYPLYPASSVENKVEVYFRYLDDLAELSKSKGIAFKDIDRFLYVFDKKLNGKL